MDRADGAVNVFAPINRIINFFDVRRKFAVELLHPGGRGCRNYNLQVGQSHLQRFDQLRANVHLADTDRMYPDDVPVGDGLFQLGAIAPKALAEAVTPAAAPPHPQEIVWCAQQQEESEDDVIQDLHRLSTNNVIGPEWSTKMGS